MALFKSNYNKPGPGVPKNAPAKKGVARLFELLQRDFGNLFKLNLLLVLCFLPAQVLFLMASISLLAGDGFWFLAFGVLALVASALVGPARSAESYVITKMLRDDPGFFWHDFKKAFKENFRVSVFPGIFYSLIIGSQILALLYYFAMGGTAGFVWIALFIFSVLIFFMVSPYFFVQVPYMQLGPGAMLKNSLFLGLGNAPRSIAGGLLYLILVGAQIFVFPFALPVTIAIGYAIPSLLNLFFIWPMVNKTFKIDETLKARGAQELDDALEEKGKQKPPLAEE